MINSTIETPELRTARKDAGFWQTVLMKFITRRMARIGRERRIRRDIDGLRALNDRMLADIGLSRCDVEYAVRHGRLPDRANGRAGVWPA